MIDKLEEDEFDIASVSVRSLPRFQYGRCYLRSRHEREKIQGDQRLMCTWRDAKK